MAPKDDKILTDKLVQRQSLTAIRDAVEKFVRDFEAVRDRCQVQVRIETLDRVNVAFSDVQDTIERLDPENLEAHLTERVDFEHRYCAAKGYLLSKRPTDAAPAQLNSSFVAQPAPFHLRLPQIDLPRFNGDFSRWLSFRDTFSSMVHSNADIPTVAKLQYLLQSLEGEAKKPFESVEIEADNYACTWDALLKRYDNRRCLKRQLFRALYDLPTVKQESAKRLHSLVDDFQRHVRALAKLNEPVEHWDTPLVNIMSYKLDQSTLRAWEEKTSTQDDVKYDELVEFLYQRVRVLNSVGYEHHQQPASPSKVAGTTPKSAKIKFAASAAASSNTTPTCPLSCPDNHVLRNCPIFLGKDVRLRRELVTQKRLCWNCLGSGHQSKKCSSKFTCRTCREKHHSLLHDPALSKSPSSSVSSSTSTQQPSPSTSVESQSSAPPQVSMAAQTACNTVLLETVVLNVIDDHGNEHQARALLDSASMSNFISKPLAKLLFNPRSKVDISIAGIGLSTQNVKSAITATIQSRTQEFSTKLEFLILKNPSAQLPTIPINISSWNIPKVALADPQFHVPGRIDLVIGSEAFWELHSGRKIPLGDGLPWLTETPFGWAVAGTASSQYNCIPRICNLSTKDDPLEATLQRFWEIEDISDGPARSVEENRCEEHYAATTTRDPSGRYIVSLPRTGNPMVVLGSSKEIADRRLLSVERRLERDPATKDAYHRFMDEYLQLGHMKKLEEPVDDSQPHCYIPHHAVFKESSTTTKVRVVFDASCKTSSGYSLNDTLLVGPVVQEDLYSIILRFRIRRIAIVADVEKMYRQMLHFPEDRRFLRIRFRESPSDPISTYELQTVTYGTASAPYLATRTLQQIAHDNGHLYPAAVDPVIHDCYVDDLLSEADDVESAIQVREQVTSMLNTAGFPIKKWASNVPEVLVGVPTEDLALQPLHDLQDEQAVSTLGLVWEPRTDTLRFKVQLPPPAAVLTKRKVMSYIAQIFDPLGLVGPTIVVAKLFMQRLWALKHNGETCEWDSPLPIKLQQEWKEFHSTLHMLGEVRVPRFASLSNVINLQLHFFSDASKGAYGSCCYVRAETRDGVSVQLLTAKSKVAPLSSRHSIARLELCAARLSTQLFQKVLAALKIPAPAYFWTDSTTVLHWLRSPPSRWKAFVANRVSQIQHAVAVSRWKHVPGINNPADDISRGLNPIDILQCKRWWNGPDWLTLSPANWPNLLPVDEDAEASTEEMRKVPVVSMGVVQSDFHDELFARFSSFSKLRRVIAFCLRYLRSLQERAMLRRTDPEKYNQLTLNDGEVAPLTSGELQTAEVHLCRLAQRQSFAEELSDLASGERVTKSSALKWLKPFVDQNGLIRVGGRLRNAALSDFVKHPIVLSAKHALSTLLASFFHLKLLHAGPQLLLATLRQKYWILGGRNLTKSVFHHCHTCFRSKPTLVQQSTADLPASRVSPTRPFSVCGVDYCGPFFIKPTVRNRAPTKAYVAVFVCFATRAVHIELVSDLTTAAFLAALRRVVARRGRIAELHSDNATTFKGASHALNRIYQMLKVDNADRDRIFNWCSENEIRWKFIPPRAPHFGGLWEAAVKSAKKHLLKTVGNSSIAYEPMVTLLAQVEMCLNSRPLTPMPSEPSDLEVLTPGHFFVGSNLQAVPEVDFRGIPDNRLESYELVQKHLQNIWARWYPEYLQQLQSRATKGCNPPVVVEVDRIVVIKEDNVPPASWPLGRIIKLHPGKDGVVRVVTLRTAPGKDIVRAVAKIALLPSPDPSL
ncbi:uncharacterized protein LOC115265150 [Aedes albopictus]|uniref:Integrase catalytic domain-containing protein n=1 Tax=Aedes albopictus TaxID=7160 RepID=A0ABM1XX79_AEDAL